MPTAIVADGVPDRHTITLPDTPSPALTGDAADLIASLWQPRFPAAELVEQAAALLPRVRDAARAQWLTEGPRPFIRIGPGVVEVRSKDFARQQRADERQRRAHGLDVDVLADYLAEHGRFPDDPEPTRTITSWSAKSRANMVRTLGLLDFGPMYADRTRLPAMTTLTYPGDWQAVAPSGAAVKAHLKSFRKRYERAWGEPLRAVWKLEFQRRGAPHVHMLMVPPHGQVDGQTYRAWLSATWADVVDHPDPDERRRHQLAGTGVDYAEGLRASDPKRIAVYFTKHSQFRDKEYQHVVPEEWQTAATGPGRFWGYWRLDKATAVVELDQAAGVHAGRLLRRWSAAQQVTRQVSRPRTRGGRPISRYPEVIGLAGAWLVESRPEPTYRNSRTRARRMRGGRGFVMTDSGPGLAVDVARYLAMALPADE